MKAVVVCLAALIAAPAFGAGADWSVYGGGPDGNRYSTLTQITRANVGTLAPAWTYAMDERGDPQTHPLAIDGVVYAYTPSLKPIALDGATGKLLWQFDSGEEGHGAQRGLTWWSDGHDKRLFASVMHYLYALDPATGKPIASFGENGRIDLRHGLGHDEDGYVTLTSPGVIFRDMLIVGFRTAESAPAPPGDIRAFDVHTGKLRWVFHTIPRPDEFGYTSWPNDAWKTAGSANNWTGMTLDVKRGILYVPTGSAVSDFYGADRKGDDLFANCLLALDAATGKRLWHFQGVHHDVLDRDFPSPPVLLTIRHNGRLVDAVAQPSKQGYLFVLDRITGKPLFPVTEAPVPQSDVPGEATSPTQPSVSIPAPYARQHLTEDTLTNRTPAAHAWAVEQFRGFASGGPFTPLRTDKQTVVFPGFDGGAEWGGSAANPKTGVIYLNANDVAWTGGLTATKDGHYQFTGYHKFLDPDGYPAVAPPWGTFNAIDLNSGRTLWRIPLGEYPDLADQGVPTTGSENYGGPILTASGLLFIGATLYDKKIRAFDAANGELLWQAVLPQAGNATPITYVAGGRQFILIQTDNARDRKTAQGASYAAFALPQ
jgi:quinoprotein glucose dehydrogenase